MQSLERRIAELEKAGSTGEGPMTIIIRCMTPGNLDVEIQKLHDWKNGQQWMRQPGETEQEFIDRATREVKRDGPGCALLMAGA
jgi:hypothetical protein